MALLDDIATYLAANSTSFTVGTNLFKGKWPSTPNTCTAIYEQAGPPPVWTFSSTAPAMEMPRLQLLTRSTSYPVARALAETGYKLLDHAIVNSQPTTSAPVYLQIAAAHTPADAGPDGNERFQITTNFDVQKRRS